MKDVLLFSSELFSNYQTNISLYNISNIEEIINIFKSRLIDLFENNNLFNLSEIVKKQIFISIHIQLKKF